MKIISSTVHGILDYIVGLALLAAPNIFGFADGPTAAVWIPRILGLVILLQAIATDYELGVLRKLRFSMHLKNDYVAGLFLAASPWLFGFNKQPNNVWMPHLVVGLFIFISTLMTNPQARGTATARR
ncbi:MAG TPA: SPW repeat protein [Chthoniobacterales bacterium]